ncbi:MAG: hypothetical protein KJ044_14985 [Planctomycetes bacterium]|nr:hypothetical protein [Planctomycetota bacterium]
MNAEAAYVFAHALVQRAAYDLHLPTERAALHRAALTVLDVPGRDPEQLLPHALGILRDLGPEAENGLTDTICNLADEAARQARLSYNHRRVLELEALVRTIPGAPDGPAASVALAAAQSLTLLGRVREAATRIRLAARLADRAGDTRMMLRARKLHAEGHANAGRPARALQEFDDMLRLAREAGDKALEVGILGNIAILRDMLKQPAEAHYHTALDAARAAGLKPEQMVLLGNLGRSLFEHGRADEARELQDRRYQSFFTGWLGGYERGRGNHDRARQLLQDAARLAAEVGDRMLMHNWRCELAELDAAQGRPEAAIPVYVQAIADAAAGTRAMAADWRRRLRELKTMTRAAKPRRTQK